MPKALVCKRSGLLSQLGQTRLGGGLGLFGDVVVVSGSVMWASGVSEVAEPSEGKSAKGTGRKRRKTYAFSPAATRVGSFSCD